MIPLKDEHPIHIFPFATIGLIFANLLVFLYEVNLGPEFEQAIFLFGAVPYNITHPINPLASVTLLTAIFFHGDFLHLASNMIYLWVFGDNIEDKLGHLRFIYFYLACGIVSTLGFVLLVPNSHVPLIGASTAVSGILGAYFLLYPKARVLVLIPLFVFWKRVYLPAFWFLLIWIAMQFIYGSSTFGATARQDTGGVAWFAHIIGFISGAVFLIAFSQDKQ
jgi:membrane associated rhomboid family serine protease